MKSPKHTITATIEGNDIDIVYRDGLTHGLEIHTVTVLLIILGALKAKTIDTPAAG